MVVVNADVFREPIRRSRLGLGWQAGKLARVSRPEVVLVLGVAP